MFKKFLGKIENAEITLKDWILGFLCVAFIRILLENFSNVSMSGFVTSDVSTIVHYNLFFAGIALTLLLIIGVFTSDFKSGEKFILFGLLIMWFPPIFDLITSSGSGTRLAYPIGYSLKSLLAYFFYFLGKVHINGVTSGIYFEILSIIFGVCLYVIFKTRSVLKGVAAGCLAYLAVFLWSAVPSFLVIVYNFFAANGGYATASQFFAASTASSLVGKNFLHPTIILTAARGFEIFFNVMMSQVFYIAMSILFAVYMYLSRRRKTAAVIRNCRPLRALYYYAAFILGFLLAMHITHPHISFNWLDIVSLFTLGIAYFCAGSFAIGVNDLADVEIDKVSNQTRPLVSGELTETDMKNANFFFLIWALAGGFISGHFILFLMLAILALSYIYSAPPLELKRIPVLESFLISLVYLAVFMSGFFTSSADQSIRAFPLEYMFLIIVTLTLATTVKDIKDIEGDRRVGAMTIPVLFGEKNGKRVVGICLALAFLLVPLILKLNALIIPSILAAILAYVVVNRKPYREWLIFALYFAYAAAVVILF
jgi:geranylgeranylglycerol-phosphate geranylgeranyltransferase